MFKSSQSSEKLVKRAAALKARMSPKERCALAVDIGQFLDDQNNQDQEREIALAIVEKLVSDETERVRVAISQAIAHNAQIPRALAEQLARDINDVAIPVLELSPTLTERFLEEIILSGSTEKIVAISRRKDLSSRLAHQIVSSGRTKAVRSLLDNLDVSLDNQTLITVVRVYGDDPKTEEALFNRDDLPTDVINALYTFTEAHVATFLRRYFNLSDSLLALPGSDESAKKSSLETRPWWDTKKGAV